MIDVEQYLRLLVEWQLGLMACKKTRTIPRIFIGGFGDLALSMVSVDKLLNWLTKTKQMSSTSSILSGKNVF